MKARASAVAHGGSLLSGLALALLPKCPLCFAAYGSALGAFAAREGVSFNAYFAWIRGLFLLLVTASLGLVMFLSWRRRDLQPVLVGGSGALMLIVAEAYANQPAEFAGVALLAFGTWLNARACRRYHATDS